MKATLATLSLLIKSGQDIKDCIGSSHGNPIAFSARWDAMSNEERGKFLAALDSVICNTRVLGLTEVDIKPS